MDFDEILSEIGEFGKFQITNYLLLCLPVFFAAANSLTFVFTAGIPNYRCLVPECDLPINPVYDQSWVPHAVPGKTDANGIFTPDQCNHYRVEKQHNSTITENLNDTCPAYWFTGKTDRCNHWVYEDEERTIVHDLGLTCIENQWKVVLVGTMHYTGILIGSGVFGVLADKYGRKPIFIFSIIFMSITGIGQGLATDYITFLVFAFLNALGTSGVFPQAFIIGVEMVGRRKREMAAIILNYFYALGEATIGLVMWLSRDWVTFQLIVSIPPLLFIFYYWMVPESVRWLIAKNYNNRAKKIIYKAAKTNGVVISDTVIRKLDMDVTHETDQPIEKNDLAETENKKQILNMLKGLITSHIMVIRMLTLVFIWVTNSFVYYGLSLNSTHLSGNKYLNFVLVCLIEIPGYSLAWVCMNKIGRKWSLAGALLLSGTTCISGAFVSETVIWALICLFLIGKLGITVAYAIVYVHTAEMLPTIIRSGGVGSMATIASLGAMIAPFVSLLKIYMETLPLLLFGGAAIIAGFLALTLPETLGRKLPETISEAENLEHEDSTLKAK